MLRVNQKQGDKLMPSKPEARIQELHLTLPPPPKPVAKYKTAVQVGNMLYVSGHGPLNPDGTSFMNGRVGENLSLEQGKEAARLVGLAILSTVRNTLGSLDKVKRLVKTLGMVNSTPEFKDHPKVINGFSELWPRFSAKTRVWGHAVPLAWALCLATSPSR